jgi:predicted dithiol-disulfide oxidoreductase (DUF899 family)
MATTPSVTREEYNNRRAELLAAEKELTRQRDIVSKLRRQLPRVKLDKDYVLEGAEGKVLFSSLFKHGTDLMMYHFMFDPTSEKGCSFCSCWADNFNGLAKHFERKCNFIVVAKAPFAKLKKLSEEKGWTFPFYSSFESDFNSDFQFENTKGKMQGKEVSLKQAAGASVFHKEGDTIYHTYTTRDRGLENLNSVFSWLDMLPDGRDGWSPVN